MDRAGPAHSGRWRLQDTDRGARGCDRPYSPGRGGGVVPERRQDSGRGRLPLSPAGRSRLQQLLVIPGRPGTAWRDDGRKPGQSDLRRDRAEEARPSPDRAGGSRVDQSEGVSHQSRRNAQDHPAIHPSHEPGRRCPAIPLCRRLATARHFPAATGWCSHPSQPEWHRTTFVRVDRRRRCRVPRPVLAHTSRSH